MQHFTQYVLRNPLLSLEQFYGFTNNYSPEKLLSVFSKPVIQQALYAASPALFAELVKWQNNANLLSIEKRKSLEISLYKYLSRMSTRCTPFGYFAACSVGEIAEETNIELPKLSNYHVFTQFDSQFYHTFLQHLAAKKTTYCLSSYKTSAVIILLV